jgi:hypothetical protein
MPRERLPTNARLASLFRNPCPYSLPKPTAAKNHIQ